MSNMPTRAVAGLAAVLGLAAFTAPALGGGTPDDAPALRTAAATGPVVVGQVEDQAPSPAQALTTMVDRLAERAVAAAETKAAEDAAAFEAFVAAVEAEEARKAEAAALVAYAAAVEAEEAREAEAAALVAYAAAVEAQQAQPAPTAQAPAGSLDAIIQRHFGSAWTTARRVAECESSMNPNAVSATDDHGLFQINAVHRSQFEAVTGAPWSSIYDPNLNTMYARHLYSQQGWGPWTCA